MTKGSNSDIQAVVLCGSGHGLDPLVDLDSLHKCLLPIANKPMLYYPITWLQQSGITDIILVVHKSLHSKIGQFLKLHINESGNRISIFAAEEFEGGTVGALQAVRPLLDRDFILLSCDLITDFPLYRMIDQHRTSDALVTTLLTKEEPNKQDEARYGGSDDCQIYAAVDETEKRLLYIKGKADVSGTIDFQLSMIAKTNLTDAHCYIFRKSFLNMLDLGTCFGKRTLYSVREELIPRLIKHQTHPSHSKGAPAKGYTCAVRLLEDSFCVRVNSLRNYSEANKFIARLLPLGPGRISSSAEVQPKSQVGSDSQIGDFTKVGEKTSIKKSTVGNNCVIGRNVKLSNCIVMDGVVIEDNCKIDNCLIALGACIKEKCALKDCDIGPRYQIAPDANLKGEVLSLIHDGM